MSASNAGQSIKPECSVLPDVSSSNGNSFFWTNGGGGEGKNYRAQRQLTSALAKGNLCGVKRQSAMTMCHLLGKESHTLLLNQLKSWGGRISAAH